MPRRRSEAVDLATQQGRLVWARCYAGYPSSRVAADLLRWNENNYKAHETGERGKTGIPPDELVRYAKAFKVDLTWLAFGTGKPLKDVEPNGGDVLDRDWLKERYEAGPVAKRRRYA